MIGLRIVTEAQLTRLSATAADSPRLRANLNLHPRLNDSVQRLFNAMELGTYVRPHRHAREEGWECMLAVRGAFAVLVFDDAGKVAARAELTAGSGDAAVEIPPFTWHTVAVLLPGTVMFEVKVGPYRTLENQDFAPWAPPEGTLSASDFVTWFERAIPGATAPAHSVAAPADADSCGGSPSR